MWMSNCTSHASQEPQLCLPPFPGPYLVCNDCLVLVHSRIKLPTTKLASPAPGDSASSNATQGTTWKENQDG